MGLGQCDTVSDRDLIRHTVVGSDVSEIVLHEYKGTLRSFLGNKQKICLQFSVDRQKHIVSLRSDVFYC